MFKTSELSRCFEEDWFKECYIAIERNILRERLGFKRSLADAKMRTLAGRFSQAVLASAPQWNFSEDSSARLLCATAADIEAGIGLILSNQGDSQSSRSYFLRASILYDLAGMPGAAASISAKSNLDSRISNLFTRRPGSLWGQLIGNNEILNAAIASNHDSPLSDDDIGSLVELSISEAITEFGRVLQSNTSKNSSAILFMRSLADNAVAFSIGLGADEINALTHTMLERTNSLTTNVLSKKSSLSIEALSSLGVPLELWPVQKLAINDGLMEERLSSFGLAAPTGTGKTALTRILIADFCLRFPEKKVIYVCPSRALVSQVGVDVRRAVSPLGLKVAAVGHHLTVHEQFSEPTECNILVFTPEKADLVLRVDPEFISQVGLVIVDEAHHIEQGTRGILLEFYLWRLRKIVSSEARIVQLSAVAPNVEELVQWLALPKSYRAVKLDWRTSRLRVGILERTELSGATLKFDKYAPFKLFDDGKFPSDDITAIAHLAERLARKGTVLVLTTRVAQAELIAATIAAKRKAVQDPDDEISERYDASVERELYDSSPLRELYKKRVAFHHARLPPKVRSALEAAISDKKIDIVCATTTLAEGVNFPFTTVIVQTLIGDGFELSPRALWNIAGRAGRFGVDTEGHCILFCPSAWSQKLKEYKVDDYLRTELDQIPPVRSALSTAFDELKRAVDRGDLELDSLNKLSLDDISKRKNSKVRIKKVRGMINMIRVGFVHSEFSGISNDSMRTSEITRDLLGFKHMDEDTAYFANQVCDNQRTLVRNAFKNDRKLLEIAARIGWSLESQENIFTWVKELEDWQLKQFGLIVAGGNIRDFNKLGFLIGPLSNLISEFEGDKLGGFTAFVSTKWLEGITLTDIKNQQKKDHDFGDLVRMIYARVQYLLPWALFGLHELVAYDAKRRGIRIGTGVRDLSVLAAEGVPNFDALTLVLRLGIERVDATRLSAEYRSKRQSADIVGWFKGLDWKTIERLVRGPDKRRLDPDLQKIWRSLRDL